MADMNNVQMVQKQIKAFNKAWSRADSAKVLSMEYNDIISDLVGADRLTKGRYAKAGVKYLQSLSDYQLAALSADIQQAMETIQVAKISNELNIEEYDISDVKGAVWQMYNKLMTTYGTGLDSEQVKSLEKSITSGETSVVSGLKEMRKFVTQKNYGNANFKEYVDSLSELE